MCWRSKQRVVNSDRWDSCNSPIFQNRTLFFCSRRHSSETLPTLFVTATWIQLSFRFKANIASSSGQISPHYRIFPTAASTVEGRSKGKTGQSWKDARSVISYTLTRLIRLMNTCPAQQNMKHCRHGSTRQGAASNKLHSVPYGARAMLRRSFLRDGNVSTPSREKPASHVESTHGQTCRCRLWALTRLPPTAVWQQADAE